MSPRAPVYAQHLEYAQAHPEEHNASTFLRLVAMYRARQEPGCYGLIQACAEDLEKDAAKRGITVRRNPA